MKDYDTTTVFAGACLIAAITLFAIALGIAFGPVPALVFLGLFFLWGAYDAACRVAAAKDKNPPQ